MKTCCVSGRAGVNTHCFIGIETPNEDSLRETKKRQNMRINLVEEVEKFLAQGIGVLADMTIGFDSDGPRHLSAPVRLRNGISDSGIRTETLVAPPGTPLFDRLQVEGRIKLDSGTGFMLGRTNFVPAKLTAEELECGFRWLANELYAPRNFEHRLMRFFEKMEPVTDGVDASTSKLQPAVDSLVIEGIRNLGPDEASMVERVCRRIENSPRVSHVTMEWLRHYQQVRFMYEQGGIWDPDIDRSADPFSAIPYNANQTQ